MQRKSILFAVILSFSGSLQANGLFSKPQAELFKEKIVSISSDCVKETEEQHCQNHQEKIFREKWKLYQEHIASEKLKLPELSVKEQSKIPRVDKFDTFKKSMQELVVTSGLDKYLYLRHDACSSMDLPKRVRHTGENRTEKVGLSWADHFSVCGPVLESLGIEDIPSYTWCEPIMRDAEAYHRKIIHFMSDTREVRRCSMSDIKTADDRENLYLGLLGTPSTFNLGRLAMLPGIEPDLLHEIHEKLQMDSLSSWFTPECGVNLGQFGLGNIDLSKFGFGNIDLSKFIPDSTCKQRNFFDKRVLDLLLQSGAKPVALNDLSHEDQVKALPAYFQGVQDRVYTRKKAVPAAFELEELGNGVESLGSFIDILAKTDNLDSFFLINSERKAGHEHKMAWLGIRQDKLYFATYIVDGVFVVYEIPAEHRKGFILYLAGILAITTNYESAGDKQNQKADKMLKETDVQLGMLWGLNVRPVILETYLWKK